MITKLHLQNFRSVKDRVELPLSPLTLFTGSNSSGKSTVLKALLIISQTFRHRDINCAILLNGPLASLGSFDTVLHSESSTPKISFGFDFGEYQVTSGSSKYDNNTFFVKNATYIFSLKEIEGIHKNNPEITELTFRILRGQDIHNFGFDGQYEDYWEIPIFEDEIYLDKTSSSNLLRRQLSNQTIDQLIPLGFQSINHHFNKSDFELNAIDEELSGRLLSDIDAAFQRIRKDFITKVFYVGPLREDPKPFYRISSAFTIDEMGTKGENTAQIYDQNRGRRIPFISPSWFSDNTGDKSYSKETKTLEEALDEWMAYLGICYGIQTVDTDYWGVIRVAMNQERTKYRSINHVGVGVSQVLPILILGLLSEKNTILLFEQPELHLHPKVQSKLADFFLTMILLKKQVIIESHSEHIVNRLRLRMVQGLEIESTKNYWAENTKIYFTEKKNSVSHYNAIRVDSFSCGSEWPEGFFDENESAIERITKAAIKKRKSNSRNN